MKRLGNVTLILFALVVGFVSTYSCGGGGGGDGNNRPIAIDEESFAKTDIPTIINVLANDSDTDGDPLTVTNASDPPHGTVTINLDSTLTYTSDNAYKGTDRFTYTVSDDQGGSDTAVVSLLVHLIPNVPASTSVSLLYPKIVSDGTGNSIIIWQDRRTGSGQIYAQKMDSNMDTQWSGDGLLVSQASDQCTFPCDYRGLDIKAISDGVGGAIIAWGDYRNDPDNGDIYAQRIDGNGVALWTTNGVAICTTVDQQDFIDMVPDGSGGAFLTWWDNRKGTDRDIYAQQINSIGAVQWTTDGIAITDMPGDQAPAPKIASDDSGGAIIVWRDGAIYAQRVNSSGTTLWATSGSAQGVTVDSDGNDSEIVPDGSGGAIVTYVKGTGGIDTDVYAQRIDSSGAVLWSAGGVALTSTSGRKRFLKVAPDDSGGAIAIWNDWRASSGNTTHVYAQKVSTSGTPLWGTNGIPVCATGRTGQESHQLVADGSGGAYVAWDDYREGDWPTVDIYAQLISSNGQAQWTTDGIAITDAPYAQSYAQLISDGSTGAIITWWDLRHLDQDKTSIYAQHVSVAGTLD